MNILTIGGSGRDSLGQMTIFNDVTVFNLANKTVQQLQIEGDQFEARKGHTACLYERNQIIIFGGSDSDGVRKDIGILTLNDRDGYRGKWEKMKNIGQSIHRVNHTACIYGDNLFVFGGKDQHEKLPKSTFIALNLADNKNGWQTCDMAGYMPGKRWGHSSEMVNNQLVIYGGHDDKQFLNDLWIYNFENSLWNQITSPNGQIPEGRRGASLDYSDGKLYLFGGYLAAIGHCKDLYSFHLEDQKWERIKGDDKDLSISSYHSSVCLRGSLIIWGGQSASRSIKAITAIEFNGSSEVKLEENNLVMQGKDHAYFGQMRRLYQEKLFADIVFVVQGEEISAHKGLIASRSKFFEHMFFSGMVESQASKIEIIDMKPDTFKALLGYLYLNEIELNKERASELLEMSDKYLLDDLKTLCEQYLSQIISLQNFIDLAEMAERFEATLLQENIISYAISRLDQLNNNYPEEIMRLSKKMLWSIALKLNQSHKMRIHS